MTSMKLQSRTVLLTGLAIACVSTPVSAKRPKGCVDKSWVLDDFELVE